MNETELEMLKLLEQNPSLLKLLAQKLQPSSTPQAVTSKKLKAMDKVSGNDGLSRLRVFGNRLGLDISLIAGSVSQSVAELDRQLVAQIDRLRLHGWDTRFLQQSRRTLAVIEREMLGGHAQKEERDSVSPPQHYGQRFNPFAELPAEETVEPTGKPKDQSSTLRLIN